MCVGGGAGRGDKPIWQIWLQDTAGTAMVPASGFPAVWLPHTGSECDPSYCTSCTPQAVSDVKWRSFLNYDAFLTCQAQQTRGSSNDKGEASNTAVGANECRDSAALPARHPAN